MAGSITATVAVSALTSAIVSVATFVIGVRMSKDQGDRAALRAIYQRLFAFFRSLREAIEQGQPRAWHDYPVKSDQYVPPVRDMQRSGELNLLPPTLASEGEHVEADVLGAGSRFRLWLGETYIPALSNHLNVHVPAGKKSIERRSYRELSAGQLALMSEGEVATFIESLRDGELGVGIELALERGRTDRMYLYPEYIAAGDVPTMLNQLWRMGQDDEAATKLRADLKAAKVELDRLTGALTARIRDPHPLMESIRRSLTDALRGR